MATERVGMRRRELLCGGLVLALARPAGAAPRAEHLVAAWDDTQGRHHLGLLLPGEEQVRVVASIEVPTRCHGLACGADGTVLAVARRPGDWLLRWQPLRTGAQAARWTWAAAERRFSGHALVAPDAKAIYTTEVDQSSSQGWLVQRDATTLQETAAWPTQGEDPHDMEWLPDGQLLVANGGIRTQPETGRAKQALDRMDSSLLRIGISRGAVTGQWRLSDQRLSLRHLACATNGLVGVALQAEHDDAAQRASAPVFAVFDPVRGSLTAQLPDRPGAGYAGDIAALAQGWAVSLPRDDELLRVTPEGGAAAHERLEACCAIVPDRSGPGRWALGRRALLRHDGLGASRRLLAPGLEFDNHAVAWRG